MVHSAFSEQTGVHAIRVQNKSWLCLYISFWPLPMETKQNDFGQNTPNGTNPLMSQMNTLGLLHTDLRKQTWSTLFQIKMTYKHNKHPKQKHVDFEEVAQHDLCVLPPSCKQSVSDRDTKWTLTQFPLTQKVPLLIQSHYQLTNWLPWSRLAIGSVVVVCFFILL